MALLLIEGFDGWAASGNVPPGAVQHGYHNSSTAGNGSYEIVAAAVTNGYQISVWNHNADNTSGFITGYSFASAKTTGSFGTGFHINLDADTAPPARSIVVFNAGLNTRLFSVTRDSSNRVTINNAAFTVVATSSATMSDATTYHMEVKVTIAVSGTIEVRLNGVSVVTYSGDTSGSYTHVGLYGRDGTQLVGDTVNRPYHVYDDWYIWDSTGSVNNDWLGERAVTVYYADADGSPFVWTKSSGSDGFSLVDAPTLAVGADYVQATAPGDLAEFQFDELDSNDINIVGVKILALGQKTGSDPATLKVTTPGDSTGTTLTLSQTDPMPAKVIYDVDPQTGTTWLSPSVNALEITLEKVL